MTKRITQWILLLMIPATFMGAAELKIEWSNPEDFRDADYYYNGSEKSQKIVLTNLEKFFTRDAERFLPEDYSLEMTVTELDLAGDFEPWHGSSMQDVRIVKRIYPALIRFDYRLLDAQGTVVSEGSERLRDHMMPMSMSTSFLGRSESYPYVKSIVRDWMRRLTDE